ncbi:hypothetical protein Misp05_25970 [Micromonospora sp. NBRC 107095]|nr:hypothetical protein Misp05_25970 [Micromonospora sp. NBRC 107095]
MLVLRLPVLLVTAVFGVLAVLLALPVLAVLVAVGVGGSAGTLAALVVLALVVLAVLVLALVVLAVLVLALVVLAVLVLALVVLAVLVLALVVLAVLVLAVFVLALVVVGGVLLLAPVAVLTPVLTRRLELDLAGDLGPHVRVLLPIRADLEELDLVAGLHDVRLGVDLAVVVAVGERDPRCEHQERRAAERGTRNDLPEHLLSHDLRHSIPVVLSPATTELRPTLDGFMTYEVKDSRFDLCSGKR